ncbi:ADP-ribosyl-[dinitrogen reductase] hydrolase [Thermus arciformis]|uniref:ADP-ribosyl-[dinitrogen reductase] hydrolase n=2 Tax=Thermus arciformis TaxID=482827 RepID=A0A1G7KBI9_9DEIN|nr:ADP-ribosyl-[dinitrogen reductase] hydrolase [Thermus arciformis]
MRLRMRVEWSRGSPHRYAWEGGRLRFVGQDRPAPVNYGLLPGLLNPADGEEVDAVYLGPPLPPGEEAEGLLLGMVALADGDHKLLLAQSPEGLDPQEAARLLAWFSPERRPTLLGPEEAGAWVKGLEEKQDRRLGALLGLAVGDALGAQVEGLSKGTFSEVREMRGGGPHRLPPGFWTDDTSQALCLAESLLQQGFDPKDQMDRYLRWYREGYRSATGTCFGLGHATRRALERYAATGEPYQGDEAGAGNGPLMRLAPLVLAYENHPDLLSLARLSARTTHGAREALEATEVLAWLLREALKGAPKEALLALKPFREADLHPTLKRVVEGGFWEAPEEGPGHAPGTLAAALWAFARGRDFEEGMVLAVNLGGDADTVGAVYGELAGAHYGKEAIPERWLRALHLREEMEALALALYRMSMASPRE